jgi:hypothetical protein
LLSKIVKIALEYPCLNLIRYEENYGDGMFGSLLKPHIARLAGTQIGLEGYRVSGMKEARIIKTLEPVMSQHRLCISKKAIRQEKNQRQISRLYERRGALKHDDRVDVLAASVEYFEDTLGIDVDEAIAKNEYENRMAEIAEWENDKRRAEFLLGDRISGATRLKTLNPHESRKSIFNQRNTRWR